MMKSCKSIYLLVVLPLILSSCAGSGKTIRPPEQSLGKPIWIDTDPSVGIKNRDVDDGLALIQAFHSPEVRVIGASAVFGNADIEDTYRIGKEIVQRFGSPGLSLYKGAGSSADLGKESEASLAIAQALQAQHLTLVAIGPVTNIATVLLRRPELARNIDAIVAVAGRRPGQRFTTGSRNTKGHRDFNFELDPGAFEVILKSKVPLVLAPFEISSKVWIDGDDINRMKNGSDAARWLASPAAIWRKFWQDVFGVNGFNPFDTLAVAYLVRPDLIQCESLPIQIQTLPDDVTEERMQGSKANLKPYLLISKDFNSDHHATYCFEAARDFKADLLSRIGAR